MRSNILRVQHLCNSIKDMNWEDQQTLLTELEAERQQSLVLKQELVFLQIKNEKLQDSLTHAIKSLEEDKSRGLLSQKELTGEIASLKRQNDEMKAEVTQVKQDRDAIKEFLTPLFEFLNN
jgi:hypothetical protein